MLDAAQRCDPGSAARSSTSDTRGGCGVIAARSNFDAVRFTARSAVRSANHFSARFATRLVAGAAVRAVVRAVAHPAATGAPGLSAIYATDSADPTAAATVHL